MTNNGTRGEKTLSNTHKDDVLTQDSRLADCRGAEFTVKVAVGPKTCSRTLDELVAALGDGTVDPLSDDFLELEAVQKRDRCGDIRFRSNDSSRFWCLKKLRRILGRPIEIRIRVRPRESLPPELRRFIDRSNAVCDNEAIRLRGKCRPIGCSSDFTNRHMLEYEDTDATLDLSGL